MSSFTSDPEVRITKHQTHGRTIFVLLKDFEYRVGDYDNPREIIRVPVGFQTDLTSVPLFLGIDYAHRAHAAIIHDFLLRSGRDPAEADDIFREALGVLGMGWVERSLYWLAVRSNSIRKQLLGEKVKG